MRVAFYGGSFDPPHVGHALVAAWVLWTGRADAVWLVPVGAHAFGKSLSPFDRRRAWTEALAATVGVGARCEPIEATLPTPTYTYDTLEALAARHPEHRFRLVLGADNLPGLPRWHRWDELRVRVPRIVVGRVGHPSPAEVPSFPDISSTRVRRALAAGEDVSAWVPAPVLSALTEADRERFRVRVAAEEGASDSSEWTDC
jgi:nicotinate-nucleotide adenylyltransferase